MRVTFQRFPSLIYEQLIMAVTITASTPPTAITGLTGQARVTGGTRCVCGADPSAFFRAQETMFMSAGWNIVVFEFPAPITLNRWELWIASDYESGNRAISNFELYGSVSTPVRNDFDLITAVHLDTPYFTAYGGDQVKVDCTLDTPFIGQWFAMVFQSLSWGFKKEGARIAGFQMT